MLMSDRYHNRTLAFAVVDTQIFAVVDTQIFAHIKEQCKQKEADMGRVQQLN